MAKTEKNNQTSTQRPPIVVVLGHVDHGKTTLLDAIRKTRVASGEAGGITQGIGASVVTTKDGKKITFVDTPGHAVFSDMRARGAKLADIAILVVAADDGIMPQTREAIDYIKAAEIPFIVAINKVDLQSSDPEMVKGQLEKAEIYLEGRGGDTPVVLVSAKTKTGIDDLLEVLNLVAEVNGIKGDKNSPLSAVVIETGKDRSGLVASVVVKDGVLRVGDEVVASNIKAKVRGLFGEDGKGVKEVLPGEPAVVLGFSELPKIGANLVSVKTGEVIVEVKKVARGKDAEGFPIVVKASHQGMLEAILASIPKGIAVMSSGVGDVTESDVFVAKASNATIFVFDAKLPSSVKKLSETESVLVEHFEIIYELIKRLEEIVKGGEDVILGRAEILQTFPFEVTKKIAGTRMLIGEFKKKDMLELIRDSKKVGDVKVITLRKGKHEVDIVKNGEEFGVYFEPQLDFKPKDVLLSSRKSESK